MEKNCPGKQGHFPSRVVYNLREKGLTPLPDRANSTLACSGCLALTELTRPGGPKLGG